MNLPTMTPSERAVIDLLAEAWNTFLKLPTVHPQEREDFLCTINTAQRLVMARPAQEQFNNEPDPNGTH